MEGKRLRKVAARPSSLRRVPLGPLARLFPAECLHESARSPALLWNPKSDRRNEVNYTASRSTSDATSDLLTPEAAGPAEAPPLRPPAPSAGSPRRPPPPTSPFPTKSPPFRSNYSEASRSGPTCQPCQTMHPNHETLPVAKSGLVARILRIGKTEVLAGNRIRVRCLAIQPKHPTLWPRLTKEAPRSMRPFHTRTAHDSTHMP